MTRSEEESASTAVHLLATSTLLFDHTVYFYLSVADWIKRLSSQKSKVRILDPTTQNSLLPSVFVTMLNVILGDSRLKSHCCHSLVQQALEAKKHEDFTVLLP